jgi:hypothetical protein
MNDRSIVSGESIQGSVPATAPEGIEIENGEGRQAMALPHCKGKSSGLAARRRPDGSWGFLLVPGKSAVMEVHS